MYKSRLGIWVYSLMAYPDKTQEWYKAPLASGKIPFLCCSEEIPLVSTQAATIRSRGSGQSQAQRQAGWRMD